jgi:hypothetical protein
MKTATQQLFKARNRHAFGMQTVILVLAALVLSTGLPASAAPITIDFENLPGLAGAAQQLCCGGCHADL